MPRVPGPWSEEAGRGEHTHVLSATTRHRLQNFELKDQMVAGGPPPRGPDTSQTSLSTNPLQPIALLLQAACRQLRAAVLASRARKSIFPAHTHSPSLHKYQPLDAQTATHNPEAEEGWSLGHMHALRLHSCLYQVYINKHPNPTSGPFTATTAATQNSAFLASGAHVHSQGPHWGAQLDHLPTAPQHLSIAHMPGVSPDRADT